MSRMMVSRETDSGTGWRDGEPRWAAMDTVAAVLLRVRALLSHRETQFHFLEFSFLSHLHSELTLRATDRSSSNKLHQNSTHVEGRLMPHRLFTVSASIIYNRLRRVRGHEEGRLGRTKHCKKPRGGTPTPAPNMNTETCGRFACLILPSPSVTLSRFLAFPLSPLPP